MRRIILAVCILILLPMMAHAYTIVLKDGRRIEVQNQYRIVNEIAVFTLPEGNRFSISLQKINIAETELANGVEPGMFVKSATPPPKASDQPAKSAEEESPIIAGKRPGSHRITNKDFERYRARREEMARNTAAKSSKNEVGPADPKAAEVKPVLEQAKTEAERDSELLAKRRELEKDKEEYWRGRSRPLLTQMRVLEDQIAIVAAQIDENKRNPLNQNNNVQIYSTQPGYYPYPPVRIGGVPIWIGGGGGGRTTGGGSTVIIQGQNPTQQRAMTLQERLTELQLQYQETLIQYEELREEGRKAGALPGWFR